MIDLHKEKPPGGKLKKIFGKLKKILCCQNIKTKDSIPEEKSNQLNNKEISSGLSELLQKENNSFEVSPKDLFEYYDRLYLPEEGKEIVRKLKKMLGQELKKDDLTFDDFERSKLPISKMISISVGLLGKPNPLEQMGSFTKEDLTYTDDDIIKFLEFQNEMDLNLSGRILTVREHMGKMFNFMGQLNPFANTQLFAVDSLRQDFLDLTFEDLYKLYKSRKSKEKSQQLEEEKYDTINERFSIQILPTS